MAAALDRASGGRLQVNIVPGGDATELAADGVFLEHDARFAQADEFLNLEGTARRQDIDLDGEHFRSSAASWSAGVQQPHPRCISAAPHPPPTTSRPGMSMSI